VSRSEVLGSGQPPAKKTAGQIEKETMHDIVLYELYGIGYKVEAQGLCM